jgi:hypothetical protein
VRLIALHLRNGTIQANSCTPPGSSTNTNPANMGETSMKMQVQSLEHFLQLILARPLAWLLYLIWLLMVMIAQALLWLWDKLGQKARSSSTRARSSAS